MLTDIVNRHVVQPLAAAKRGSRHLRYLRDLRRTQFDSPDVVRARQLDALKATLRHAYATVPHYQRAWWDAGVHPDDIDDFDDLRQLPVVTKDDLRGNEERFLSTAFDRSKLYVKKTSGSTGVPLTIRIDERSKQWKYATTLRADEWSGWRLGQRVAKAWGNPEYRRAGLRGRLRNAVVDRATYLDTRHLADDVVRAFARHLRRHPPGLLFGHAHSLYLLADRMRADGVTDVRPNGVVSTAMPLHSWQRAVIEDVFGVKATDRYGCEEVSLIACECERHRGLHVNADSVYVEVEDAVWADGRATGRLIVTDLTNPAMPLIRYRVGDVVTLTDRLCECGRGLPLIEDIQGRDADYVVTPSGGLISGISLTENFAVKIDGTAQVQIIQEQVTLLRLRVVPARAFGDHSRRQIAALVRDTFGPGVRHELELVDRIEQEPSGKYRFCVSKVAPDFARAVR